MGTQEAQGGLRRTPRCCDRCSALADVLLVNLGGLGFHDGLGPLPHVLGAGSTWQAGEGCHPGRHGLLHPLFQSWVVEQVDREPPPPPSHRRQVRQA